MPIQPIFSHLPITLSSTERRDGKRYPMVVCAMYDVLACTGAAHPVFVLQTDIAGYITAVLRENYPDAAFIGVDHLTEGQACTCLLAKEFIDNDEPLFIAGCDNGMVCDHKEFSDMMQKAEVMVFTYRHNEAVLEDPNAYGWVFTEGTKITGVSVKKAISDTPMEDHAIVASFWFRHGSDFVRCAEEMIAANDRINGEFYVDKVIDYCVRAGLDTRVFELEKYLGWGTPLDYENYENTIRYWRTFTSSKRFLPKIK